MKVNWNCFQIVTFFLIFFASMFVYKDLNYFLEILDKPYKKKKQQNKHK